MSSKSLKLSRTDFDQVEHLLRRHKERLCDQATTRFLEMPASRNPLADMDQDMALLAQIGALYMHDLVVVVAALYPSEITLRHEYEWAMSGTLRRHGVGYAHQAAILRAYFAGAREVLMYEPSVLPILDVLEIFMTRVLGEVFLGKGGQAS